MLVRLPSPKGFKTVTQSFRYSNVVRGFESKRSLRNNRRFRFVKSAFAQRHRLLLYTWVIERIRVKMNLPITKKSKDQANKEECNLDISKEAKSIVDKILGDVSKTSATKQIIIGTTSGWLTGFVTMKVGKIAAFAVGGGIIMLQIAAHQGYIKINWDKIQKKAEKITDKVEEKVTGEGPKFMDKVERFVDKKVDKAEKLLKNGESRTRRWYHSITGDDSFRPTEIHFFLASFVAGLALGIATGN